MPVLISWQVTGDFFRDKKYEINRSLTRAFGSTADIGILKKSKESDFYPSLTGLVFSVSFSTTTAVPYASSSVM
jgi:hypothetical protein